MEQGKSRFKIGDILKIILIIVGILIICAVVFATFKLMIGARAALRDAKDIQMALETADVEMYAASKTVYNPRNKYGIEDGVKEMVEEIVVPDGQYYITSYSTASREITGFKYTVGRYVVYYKKNGKNVEWDVDYVLRVYRLRDKED